MKKKVVVIGGGESGIGVALLARQKNFDVFVSDNGQIKEKYKTELKDKNILFEEGGHDFERCRKAQVIVKSPGVPDNIGLLSKIRKLHIPVISEIEFGYSFCTCPIVAVTGSNGKTTTSGLLHHLLSTAGIDSALCGNIGKSFCRTLSEKEHEWIVLEVSSFQLDNIDGFRPDIGVILNITPDHLDRYADFTAYGDAKMRLAENQSCKDFLIVNGDDESISSRLNNKNGQLISLKTDDYKEGITSKEGGSTYTLTIKEEHNLMNARFATEAARLIGIEEPSIEKALRTFKNADHRLEVVAKINGITFINDSKATNVEAALQGLKSVKEDIIWIAGGVDKGNDYGLLKEEVEKKVKCLICLGDGADKLRSGLNRALNKLEQSGSMGECIEKAMNIARRGDTVLLSPACASFDLFDNYEDRGRKFKDEVWRLVDR